MADISAEGPTLTAFTFPSVLGSLSYPSVIVGNYRYHAHDEIDVRLDHDLLTNAGAVSTLRFSAAWDYDKSPFVHYVASYSPGEAFQVAKSAMRGDYHIVDVTITDAVTGLKTSYTPAQLAAQGFSTGFAVRGTTAPADLLWQSAGGIVRHLYATTTAGSPRFQADTLFGDQHVDPSWTAVERVLLAGTSATLWHNADGRVSVWYGADPVTNAPFSYDHAPVGSEWRIAATGDANADGQGEILWQRSDGALSTWSAAGTNIVYSFDGTRTTYAPGGSFVENSYFHGSVGASWTVEGMSDFSGDNRSDILWRNAEGALSTWNAIDAGAGIGFKENAWSHAAIDLAWHVVGLGDFNGDGKDDILWRNDNGALSVWTSTGSGFVENQMNAGAAQSWQVAQVGDFNADGRADILWRNGDGAVSVWQSTGSGWAQNVFYDAGMGTGWNIVAHHFTL